MNRQTVPYPQPVYQEEEHVEPPESGSAVSATDFQLLRLAADDLDVQSSGLGLAELLRPAGSCPPSAAFQDRHAPASTLASLHTLAAAVVSKPGCCGSISTVVTNVVSRCELVYCKTSYPARWYTIQACMLKLIVNATLATRCTSHLSSRTCACYTVMAAVPASAHNTN